jgi:hypothetical protein
MLSKMQGAIRGKCRNQHHRQTDDHHDRVAQALGDKLRRDVSTAQPPSEPDAVA